MSIRAIQTARFVRCLTTSTKSTMSSVFTKESIPRCCNRLVAIDYNTAKGFCSGPSEVSGNEEDLKNSVETKEFTEYVSNLRESLGLSQTEPESIQQALVHRSYLASHAATLRQQHKHNDQLALLGLQTTKRYLTELLLQYFPHLSCQELWDVQNGIVEDEYLPLIKNFQLSKHIAYDTPIRGKDAAIKSLMALVAVVYINEGTEKSRQFVYDHFISKLDERKLKDIIKLQYPKYLLKHISLKKSNESLTLRFLKRRANRYHRVGVFKGEECITVGIAVTAELAEKRACQNALLINYPEEVNQFNFSYEAEDFESEDKIDMGLRKDRQRLITIDKGDKEFGFNIKGGEKKKLKNKDWLVYNYFSPVFICSIQPDSLADRLGTLHVGDVILAVNDRSLVGVDHAAAVKVLKEVSGTVTLTVQYSKEVLLTDQVETSYNKMQERKRLAELSSDVWAEWHQAQADKHPEKYADVLRFNEKHASQ